MLLTLSLNSYLSDCKRIGITKDDHMVKHIMAVVFDEYVQTQRGKHYQLSISIIQKYYPDITETDIVNAYKFIDSVNPHTYSIACKNGSVVSGQLLKVYPDCKLWFAQDKLVLTTLSNKELECTDVYEWINRSKSRFYLNGVVYEYETDPPKYGDLCVIRGQHDKIHYMTDADIALMNEGFVDFVKVSVYDFSDPS